MSSLGRTLNSGGQGGRDAELIWFTAVKWTPLFDFLAVLTVSSAHLFNMSDTPTPLTQAPAQTSPSTQPRSRRLMSLDALRGFDMFWIVGGEEIVHGFYEAWPAGPLSLLSHQLNHKA